MGLPEAGPVDAMVMWYSGRYFGCKFKTPISDVAVSAAQQMSPAAPIEGDTEVVSMALAELRALVRAVPCPHPCEPPAGEQPGAFTREWASSRLGLTPLRLVGFPVE